MNKQQLFSEFFTTMMKMRKILDQAIDIDGDNKVFTMLQMQALGQIKQNKQLTAGELAKNLGMSSSALTQLTNRMINAKLIDREHSETDRRVIYLTLTSSGEKHFLKTMRSVKNKTSQILDPISEKDLTEVVRIFSNFLENHSNEK